MTSHIARTMILALLLPVAVNAARPAIADRDQDGVADVDDLCPYTQSKVAVDVQGCTLDSDFDGVADGGDACPNSKFGAPVNAEGCSREERSTRPALAAAPVAAQPPAAAQTATDPMPAQAPPAAPAAPVVAAAPAVTLPPPAAAAPAAPPAAPKKKTAPRVVAAPIGGGFSNALPPLPMAPELPVDEPAPVVVAKPVPAPAPAPVAPPPAPVVAAAPMAPPPVIAPPPVDEAPAADADMPASDAEAKDHADLLPLLNDENALLAAIDRRNQQRAETEERESREQLARVFDDRSPSKGAAAPRSRASKTPRAEPRLVAPATVAKKPAPPPEPVVAVKQRNTERLLADVPFAAGRSDIGGATLKNLPALMPDLARIIERLPALRVEIIGHADPSEGARADKLAGERAIAVNAWLIGHGVPPSRIKRTSRGVTDPIGDGAANRVVEIYTYPQ